ncbi:MAG: hypothetical protein O2819_07715 [Planctomycetota bacterium]|nr:hypothetical protein [Planctomycetota bacterium]MDA1105853.1 hypothetical protein [Planctomycetota bacterium]
MRAIRGLIRLGITTRFRLSGRYWTWRKETAFGRDLGAHLSARERRAMMLEFGEWADRMHRLSRAS